ncbi:Tetratricopeptide repeat-containing protein [Chitinophaga sp. CF118]|nr:Tetratricopeptide repeat-containing protein [Chitinophaga sp. CF118]
MLVVHETTGKNNDADKLFLNAIDSYRNKKNPAGSIKLFKQSIVLKPQAKSYYELGNALFDMKKLKEAMQAYVIAELLDYKPLHKVLYNMACVYSIAGDATSARYCLISAIEFGYSNVKNIYADEDLAYLRSKGDFNNYVNAALSGATDPEKLQWNLFWHEFKPLEFPLVLDMKYGANLGEDYISYDYERFVPEMRDGQFSREVGSEYYHVGLVKNSDSVKTLIYAIREVMMSEMAPPAYYIVSFDKQGKLIDKLLIAGQLKLDEPFKVATLAENGTIQVGLFKQVYEKDPESAGYDDNKLLESKELDKENYTISSDGHFVKQQALLSMND